MDKHNAAIIGLGKWGKNLLRSFSNKVNVEYCCSTGTDENLKWLQQNFPNIKYTTNYEQIINDPDINIVVIATPIDTHFDICKKALERGKHVFLEKPPVTNPIQLDDLINIASNNDLLFFVDQIFLYHPVFQKLKEEIKEKEIVQMNFSWLKFGSFSENIFWNLAYHDFYLISDLVGNIEQAKILNQNAVLSSNDISTISITVKNNLQIQAYYNRFSNLKDKSMIVITKNEKYLWQNMSLYKLNSDKQLELIFESSDEPLNLMVQDFINKLEIKDYSINPSAITSTQEIYKLVNS